MTTETKTLYYRRLNQSHGYHYPAVDVDRVEVTDEPQKLGPYDGSWKSVDVEEIGIDTTDYSIGLEAASPGECSLIADAMICEAAILEFLGVPRETSAVDYVPYTEAELDDGEPCDYEALCDATGVLHGSRAEQIQREALKGRLAQAD
jgi:hypothetical protein